MTKKILALLLLFTAPVFAKGQFKGPSLAILASTQSFVASGGGTDAHITWYDNMDTLTTPQTPQKGTNQMTIGSAYTAIQGMVGNALDNGAASNGTTGKITIPTSGLMSASEGSMGFYWVPGPFVDAQLVSAKENQANPRFDFTRKAATTQIEFHYSDGLNRLPTTGSLTAGTTYYVILRWSISNAITGGFCAQSEIYNKDGSSISNGIDNTFCTLGAPTLDTNINLGATTASGSWGSTQFDQLMFSDLPNQDLKSIRDSTNP